VQSALGPVGPGAGRLRADPAGPAPAVCRPGPQVT